MHTVRILIVLPNLRVSNGVTNFVMNYFRNVNHHEIHIDFATLSYRESPYIKEVENVGSKVIVLPSVIRHPLQNFKECRKIVENGQYDIVHVNTLNQAIPVLLFAKKRVPARILHSHSTRMGDTQGKEAINRILLPILLKLSNYYAACSTNAGKAMFGGKQYAVIPNLINPKQFKYNEIIRFEVRNRERVSGKKVIGTVGRLVDPKNPYFALEVMKKVFAQCNEVEYWWIGSGPLDNAVQKYVADNMLSDRVRLFGSREDVSDLYQAMDLFFLPSCFEGFGLACIEAQAAGLSCVVSTGFPPEVDITGNVSFLPLSQDAATWAKKLLDALKVDVDKETAFKLCEESKYSQDNSGRLLTEYYYTCLAQNID